MRALKIIAGMAIAIMLASGAATAQSGSNGVYGGYIGSDAWNKNQENAARDMVRMDALAHHGSSGGCATLPNGWARLDVTVHFPASYGGYAGWVNTAELLPVGNDLQGFLSSKSTTGAYVRPAIRAGANTVTSNMCAPAGRAYWLIVDSGMARVAVGKVTTGAAGKVSLTAPPLHSK